MDTVPDEYTQANKPEVKYFKQGHQGLITLDQTAPHSKYTTYNNDYIQTSNYDPNSEPKGRLY